MAACEQCGGNRVPPVHPVRAFPDWLARRWKAEVLHGTARALWGPHRFKIVLATLCGARDHLRGTSGRIPARLARRLAV